MNKEEILKEIENLKTLKQLYKVLKKTAYPFYYVVIYVRPNKRKFYGHIGIMPIIGSNSTICDKYFVSYKEFMDALKEILKILLNRRG